MKKLKKAASLFLSLLIVMAMMPLSVFADDPSQGGIDSEVSEIELTLETEQDTVDLMDALKGKLPNSVDLGDKLDDGTDRYSLAWTVTGDANAVQFDETSGVVTANAVGTAQIVCTVTDNKTEEAVVNPPAAKDPAEEKQGDGNNAEDGTVTVTAAEVEESEGSNDTQTGSDKPVDEESASPVTIGTYTWNIVVKELEGVKVANEAELKEAITAAGNGPRTILVTESFTIASRIIIDANQDITLKKVKQDAELSIKDIIWVKSGAKLTLDNMTLDGMGSERKSSNALLFVNGALDMQNSTVKNAYNSKNDENGKGNGGAVYNSGTFTMNGGELTGNRNTGNGGAVYNKGTFTMEGGEITGNSTAGNGGAVYNSGTFTMNGGELIGNMITGNSTAGYGGAVYNSGTFTMNGGELTGNMTTGKGGAVYNYNTGIATIQGAVISKNSANENGYSVYSTGMLIMKETEVFDSVNGGIYAGGKKTGNCLDTVNITGTRGKGAALKTAYNGNPIIVKNSIIRDNNNDENTVDNGGAICAYNSENILLESCEISYNTGMDTGGIRLFYSTATLKDTVVKCNTAKAADSENNCAGGIFVNSLSNLSFKSGALYGNKATGAVNAANDIYLGTDAKISLLDAVNMIDPSIEDSGYFKDFNYGWRQADGTILLDSITEGMAIDGFNREALYLTAVPQKEVPKDAVYLDGTKGNDVQNGTRPAFAVRTPEKALELAKEYGTKQIYVCGEVKLTEKLDGQGCTLQRTENYKGNLLNISSGKVTLTNLTLDGNAEKISNHDAKALVRVSGGKLTLGKNAVLQNNNTTGADYPDGAVGGGVYVVGDGQLVIAGGTIQNCRALLGGAVGAFGGEICLESGKITGNHAEEITVGGSSGGGCGGGIYIGQRATMVMNGGTISGNEAANIGGGISLGVDGELGTNNQGDVEYTLQVHGGSISNNTAYASGGGIFIQGGQDSANRGFRALIDGTKTKVYIQDNQAKAGKSGWFHGGGIYVNGGKSESDGYLKLQHVLITDNESAQEGGGLAGCGTSETSVHIKNGGAIYGNTGAGKTDDFFTKELGLSPFQPSVDISATMLGGGNYNWKNVEDGSETFLNKLKGNGALHLYAGVNENDADVLAARSAARVFITGNRAVDEEGKAGRGGGIGSNGIVEIGDADPYETVEFDVEKKWVGDSEAQRPESVDVVVERSLDNNSWETVGTLRIYRGKEWKAKAYNLLKKAWNSANNSYSGDEYTYRVREKEVKGYSSKVEGDMTEGFVVTNTYTPDRPKPLPDPDTPLDPGPDDPDDPIIDDPDVPLGPGPDEPVIDDPDVPLAPTPVEEKDPDEPKTGDEAPIGLLMGMFLVSAGALGAVYIRRKEKTEK